MTTEQNTQEIAALAREGLTIESRLTEITHPDAPEDSGPAVPVILVTERDDNGNAITRPELATEILAELDARMPGPRRRKGTVVLTDVASFVQYLARYQRADASVIYADVSGMRFEAVLDEHPIADAQSDVVGTMWREFRATYACPRSPEWQAWTAFDGKPMKQEAFADFLEARLEDMTSADGLPKPLEVLDVARKLHIRTKGEFRRELNPTNGDYILVNKTETTAESTQIPRAFAIAIPVFEGGTRYQLEARVRFAIGESGPAFSYTLHRRVEIERDAFGEVRSTIESQTKLPVLSGRP